MEKTISTYKYKSLVKKDKIVLVYSFFAFFIGQTVFFSFANPFFAPILSMFFGKSNLVFLMVLIPLLVGSAFSFNGVILYTYIFIGILMFFSNMYITKNNIKANSRVRGIFCGLSVFLGGTIPVFFYSMSGYFAFYFTIFSFVSIVMPTVLESGFSILTFTKGAKAITLENTISLSIIITSFLIGTLSVTFLPINIFLLFSTFSILIISNSDMKGNTLTYAFIILLVPYAMHKIDTNSLSILLLFAFSTMLTGTKSKPLTVILSLTSLTISYLYLDKSFFDQKNIVTMALSYITFLVFPKDYYQTMQTTFGVVDNSFYPYANKIKEYTATTMEKYSSSFKVLSNSFLDTQKVETDEDKNIDIICKNTISKMCPSCKNYNMCFTETIYTTRNSIKLLVKTINSGDGEKIKEQITSFDKICINKDSFLLCLENELYIYKSEIKYESKILEHKKLMSMQLNEISKVFLSIKDGINKNIVFMPKIEKIIFETLKNNNIFPTKVLVMQNENAVTTIFITLDIDINEKEAFSSITRACKMATSQKMKITSSFYLENGDIQIKLEQEKTFYPTFGVSTKAKNDDIVSGDSFSTLVLENQLALVAISDGMGGGYNASYYSTTALDLFEEFLQSGFNIDTAIKLINSSLILKNTKDAFTTLDAVIVDLYNGFSSFIKIGAVKSFILREGKIISIKSSSVPIGILNEVETEVYKKRLKENDFVILLSDGVLDVIKIYDEQDAWIKKVIKNFDGTSAKKLSDYILKEALILSKNKAKDDMSVVVLKLNKTRH